MSSANPDPVKEGKMTGNRHQKVGKSQTQSTLTFPDGSTFVAVETREGEADHIFVKYFLDEKPQTLWVPRGFVDASHH